MSAVAAGLAVTDWLAVRGEKWSAQLSAMEAMLAPVDDPLLRALRLAAPARIADLGCGGGGTALTLARRAPQGSVVHGFDISPRLVELAQRRVAAQEAHEGSIAFDVADVGAAAPERPYDRLVSRFGVMFFDDPPAAFANLSRWLVPAGRVAFAVWGPQSENPWMSSVRDVVARIVALPQADPEAPGPFRYADARTLVALLAGAGFSELNVQNWRGLLPIGGGLPPADAADFALSSFSSFGELLAKAGDGALAEARRSLTGRFSQSVQQGAVHLDASVHIVTGARA